VYLRTRYDEDQTSTSGILCECDICPNRLFGTGRLLMWRECPSTVADSESVRPKGLPLTLRRFRWRL